MSDHQEAISGLERLINFGTRASTTEAADMASALASWCRRRDQLLASGTPVEAFDALGDLLQLIRAIADPLIHRALAGEDHTGVQLLRSLRTVDEDEERSQHLRILALKLQLAARFLDGAHAAYPLSAAVQELAAINAGDEPRLFAPIDSRRAKGLGSNAYRLAISQLRALEWDAVLSVRKHTASDRHLMLHQAFGVQWDAIRKWPSPCVKRLGASVVDQSIGRAREAADAGRPVFAELFGLASTDAINFDGRIYQDELRRRKS